MTDRQTIDDVIQIITKGLVGRVGKNHLAACYIITANSFVIDGGR